uniref:Uncharacterized protein n=1 Tax=Cyanistes caeruleus TaxID=156563 RepID=A0A8C0UAN9_CYACU
MPILFLIGSSDGPSAVTQQLGPGWPLPRRSLLFCSQALRGKTCAVGRAPRHSAETGRSPGTCFRKYPWGSCGRETLNSPDI